MNEFQASDIPLLASPQGGVAARVRKCREASTDRADGVVFRLRTKRKTTPAASASVASQNFLDDAATPPCGDARRGISLACNSVRSFNRERIDPHPALRATFSHREKDSRNPLEAFRTAASGGARRKRARICSKTTRHPTIDKSNPSTMGRSRESNVQQVIRLEHVRQCPRRPHL